MKGTDKRRAFHLHIYLFAYTCVMHGYNNTAFMFNSTELAVSKSMLAFFLLQADPRFVWNGHLLREFAAQPEVNTS